MAAFAGTRHVLEGKWGGDVTAVRGQATAIGWLPHRSCHVPRGSCTVAQVGRCWGGRLVGRKAGYSDTAAHSGQSVWHLDEKDHGTERHNRYLVRLKHGHLMVQRSTKIFLVRVFQN